MSLAATIWAWEQPLEGTAKLVLLCIADHADAEGRCFPSVDRIADRCGISARTVQRALRLLEGGGALGVEVRPGQAPLYRLDVRAVLRPLGAPGAGKVAQRLLPLVAPVAAGRGRQSVTPDKVSPRGCQVVTRGVSLCRPNLPITYQ